MAGKYDPKKSPGGKSVFNLKASSGQVTGKSETFSSKAPMKNGITSVKQNAASPVADITQLGRNKMKNWMSGLLALAFLSGGGAVMAQDVGKLVEAVDKDKAVESVDQEKMTEAVSGDGVDYKKAYDAVDKDKAAESVDMDKVKEAISTPTE